MRVNLILGYTLKKMTQHPKPRIVTFGCRLNHVESETMLAHAQNSGLQNAIIVNTCAVTNEAEREARQAIRKLRRENPNAQIIVTGCAVQTNPDDFSKMPEIDRILGNDVKMKAESFLPQTERVIVNDIMAARETASHLLQGFENQSRAFMQVQNGCDHRCTFCIIPYGRGNSRSVPMGEIAEQARILVANGYNEIVVSGVDLTSYGKDLPGAPSLGQMLRRLLALVPELKRLRLSSIDPAEMDDDLWRLIENEPRLMPHLHISLQAGDDMILKRMKRRHTRRDVIDFCKRARDLRPDMAFGADIIAGFPTESDAMFENSLGLIEECEIAHMHVFPYSARKGTPASRMPQVKGDIRKSRAKLLRQAGENNLRKLLQSRIGKREKILVERGGMGHTEQFAAVRFTASDNLPIGQVIEQTALDVKDNKLIV